MRPRLATLNEIPVQNLVNNAGDAITGPGAITISTDTNDDKVNVTVQDTGSGMTAEQLSKIFNPFYTTKEVGKGTGLGLSISYGIVKDCGGAIQVTAHKPEGACFILTFPVPGEKHEKNNTAR